SVSVRGASGSGDGSDWWTSFQYRYSPNIRWFTQNSGLWQIGGVSANGSRRYLSYGKVLIYAQSSMASLPADRSPKSPWVVSQLSSNYVTLTLTGSCQSVQV